MHPRLDAFPKAILYYGHTGMVDLRVNRAFYLPPNFDAMKCSYTIVQSLAGHESIHIDMDNF